MMKCEIGKRNEEMFQTIHIRPDDTREIFPHNGCCGPENVYIGDNEDEYTLCEDHAQYLVILEGNELRLLSLVIKS